MNACKHKFSGLCAECAEKKPFMVFKYNENCPTQSKDCKCCGYFWGPGAEKQGRCWAKEVKEEIIGS